MRVRRSLQIMLVSAMSAVGLTGMVPGTAAALPEGACTPVVVIGLRGSGEGSVNGGAPWWGPTLDKLFTDDYLLGLSAALRDAPLLEVGAPDYPAVDTNWETFNPFDGGTGLGESVTMGADAAVQAYESFPVQSGCRKPEVIFLGYSQGAMAARVAVEYLSKQGVPGVDENGPVSAVHLVGDPYQKANADGVHGGGSNGNGISRILDSNRFDKYYDIPGIRRVSLCHDNDPVCDSPSDLFEHGPHLNYFNPGVKFVERAGMAASDTDEVAFMINSLGESVTKARLDYGMGPTVTPIKDSYGGGDTVTARYTIGPLDPAFAADEKYTNQDLSSLLARCQSGINVRGRGQATPNVVDVMKVTVNGTRLTHYAELVTGVPLTAGTTYFDVSISVDDDVLARAAADAVAGVPAEYLYAESFDANRNGVIDGTEVNPTYSHVLRGYCHPKEPSPWYIPSGWSATAYAESTGVERKWVDGPLLQFSMLATANGGTPGTGTGSLSSLFGG